LIRGLPYVEGILLFDGDHYSAIGEDGGPKSLSATVKSIDAVESDYLDQPVGTAIREYSKSKRAMSLQGSGGITPLSRESYSSNNAPFLLSLADMRTDNKARQYHDQLEKLAPWWIETADCVGMGLTEGVNETGGHWKVLYLFEKHNTKSPAAKRGVGRSKSQKAKPPIAKYSLAGYMTLWFQGKNMVVCQVLLLPPYQRSGHGTELLRAAYDLAFAKCGADSMDTVSQIDVELPGKAFVALRNRLDYDLFSEAIKISHTPYSLIPSEYAKPIDLSAPRDQYITPLPDDIVSKVASKLKITRRQVQVASEIWLLSEIDKRIEDLAASTSNSHISSRQIVFLEACYESIVRRSLLQVMRANNEEKFRFLTIDEQKEALESSFKATVAHYRSILG
jgi:histone acetyltransferase 1